MHLQELEVLKNPISSQVRRDISKILLKKTLKYDAEQNFAKTYRAEFPENSLTTRAIVFLNSQETEPFFLKFVSQVISCEEPVQVMLSTHTHAVFLVKDRSLEDGLKQVVFRNHDETFKFKDPILLAEVLLKMIEEVSENPDHLGGSQGVTLEIFTLGKRQEIIKVIQAMEELSADKTLESVVAFSSVYKHALRYENSKVMNFLGITLQEARFHGYGKDIMKQLEEGSLAKDNFFRAWHEITSRP